MADKWVIGTGFSRGIGHEFAKKLNSEGFKIIHLGRKKIGFEAEHLWWDLLNPISDNPLGELHKILFGKHIHGFFYGAGVMPMVELIETNKTQKRLFWQSQAEAMRVNYLACAELIEESLPFLFSPYDEPKEKFVPFVAHLSSLSAIDPFPGLELYGATKAAALHYFTWLAKRFPAQKLTCLSIHPGTVYTDMVSDLIKNEKADLPVVKLMSEMHQQNKMITPSESAHKIFDFIFNNNEFKIKSHGKLYLADQFKIL